LRTQYWPLPGLSGSALDRYIELADQKGGAKAQEVAAACATVVPSSRCAQRIPLLKRLSDPKGEPKADSQFFVKAMLERGAGTGGRGDARRRDHVIAAATG
jgi:ATP-dependent helicase/nuclease subunit A